MADLCIRNPFSIGIVQEDGFCNRVKEKEELLRYARNGQNVVLISPRRFGKSSLVMEVFKTLEKEGYVAIYVDLFPVTSEQDFITRLATALFNQMGKGIDPRSFMEKAGQFFSKLVPTYEVTPEGGRFYVKPDPTIKTGTQIEALLAGTNAYITKNKLRVICCLDEFQEISELPESKKLEGILRSQMQLHKDISYFYVGSRRRVLEEIFSNRSRPFYKSAFLFMLKEIPRDEFSKFISGKFQASGKKAPGEAAEAIYDMVRGYPYYVQKLSSVLWDMTETVCDAGMVKVAFDKLVQLERVDFEGIWLGLSRTQKALLRAIAEDTVSPYSREFLIRNELSVGGAQAAMKVLLAKDTVEQIEQDGEKKYRLTDPVLAAWARSV